MAFTELTKQLAQQAILSATSGPEKKDPPAPAADQSGLVIFGEIQAMQRALREDEELMVTFVAAGERLRVTELFLRSPQVMIVSGQDSTRGLTRVITPVASLELLCKTVKVAAGARPVRVALVTPKKDSTAK